MNFHAALWLSLTIATLGASTALGQEEKQGDRSGPQIKIFFAENKPIKGVTQSEGIRAGEGNELSYRHKKPALIADPETVDNFTMGSNDLSDLSPGQINYYFILHFTHDARKQLAKTLEGKGNHTREVTAFIGRKRFGMQQYHVTNDGPEMCRAESFSLIFSTTSRPEAMKIINLLLEPDPRKPEKPQATKAHATKAEIVSISTVVPPEEYHSDADIVRYNDHFYIAFAKPIEENENAFHILQSVDGRDWKSAATLRSEIEERRPDITHSPHYSGRPVWFSTMPSGRLCVTGRAAGKTILWSTDDGNNWREELDIDLSRTYSRVLWQNNRAYCASDESSSCGERFELFRVESAVKGSAPETTYKLSHDSHTLTGPRESQLTFTKDRAFCLLSFKTYKFDKVRRWLIPSNSYATGKFGVSKAPYEEWTWTPTNLRFGLPNLLVLKDKRMISSVFIDGDKAHSALCQVDTSTGKMTELLRLPTGATRQPIGMTEHDGHIWACFYDGPQNRKNPPTLKVAKIKLGK